MDTTPLWLLAVFAVIVILVLILLELRHQRKHPKEQNFYTTQNFKGRNDDESD